MDDLVKVIGIGFIGLIVIIIVKQYRPEFAIYISIITGILILFFSVNKLAPIINLLTNISKKAGINNNFILIMLKITGIALLSEFAISICKDAGESAIASKVEIGSKVIIISMSIPIISNLLEVIIKLLPN